MPRGKFLPGKRGKRSRLSRGYLAVPFRIPPTSSILLCGSFPGPLQVIRDLKVISKGTETGQGFLRGGWGGVGGFSDIFSHLRKGCNYLK